MHLVPTQGEVIELLRRTGGLRKGHFEYPNGLHATERVNFVRSAEVHGRDGGCMRLAAGGRRARDDTLHARSLGRHHAHVRGSGSMALSPFAHCGCADGARSSRRRHSEQESYSGSFADSFCKRARLSHHLPGPQWWRRASLTAKSYSEDFTEDPKNKDMRTS